MIAVVAACGGREARPSGSAAKPTSPAKPVATGWQPRIGPGFEVTAPNDAIRGQRPITADTNMESFEYGGGGPVAMQVMTVKMPPGRSALEAIQTLRDHIASVGTIVQEDDVALGDALGKDVRFTMTHPVAGNLVARTRLLVQNDVIYQVQSMHPAGATDELTDRFVESFRFTEPGKATQVDAVATTPDADGWYTGHSPNGFTIRAPSPIVAGGGAGDPGEQVFVLAALKRPERIKLTATCVVGGKQHDPASRIAGTDAHRERVVGGRKALQVDADGNASYLAVFDGNRFCMLTVAPYSKSMPRQTELAAKFFDSFAFDP